MSIHDHAEALRDVADTDDPAVKAVIGALERECAAHDKTREERNMQTTQRISLQGQVRGLQGQVNRLKIDLRNAREAASASSRYAEGYAQGVKSVQAAVTELFATMGGGG